MGIRGDIGKIKGMNGTRASNQDGETSHPLTPELVDGILAAGFDPSSRFWKGLVTGLSAFEVEIIVNNSGSDGVEAGRCDENLRKSAGARNDHRDDWYS